MDAKPSPNGADLSDRLRARMRADRRGYYRSLAILVGLAFLIFAGLVWWIYPRGTAPALVIVAFDGITIPEQDVTLRAQVEAAEGDPVPDFLGRLQVTFQEARSLAFPGDQLRTVTGTTQSSGQVQAKLAMLGHGGDFKFLARLLSDRRAIVSEDPARIAAIPADTPLVVVEVAQLLAAPAVNVWNGNLAGIQHHADAAESLQALKSRKYQIVYLALDSDRAATYRQQRRWLESRQAVLPAGPVLGRPSYHQGESEQAARQQIAIDLARKHKLLAIVQDGAAAAIYRDLKVLTVILGNADAPPGVKRAASWKDIPQLLGKE